MPRKKTHEEFVKEVFSIYGNKFTVIGVYTNNKNKIEMYCNKHNQKFEITPNQLLSKKKGGCKQCISEAKSNALRTSLKDFIQMLEEKQPNIKYISGYGGIKSNITVSCKIHNEEVWTTQAYNIINGLSPCKICSGSKLSHEQFVKKVQEIHKGKISVIGKYKGSNNNVKLKCNICHHEWNPVAYTVIRKNANGCPRCHPRAKQSSEQFLNRLNKIHKEKIELIDNFVGLSYKHKFFCKICEYEWKTTAMNLVKTNPTGCPKCSGVAKLLHEEYVKRINEKTQGKIEIIGLYEGMNKKIKAKCKICNYTWETIAQTLINVKEHGCPNCAMQQFISFGINYAKQKNEKAKKDFINKVKLIHGDKYIIIDEYQKSDKKIKVYCEKHGIFEITPEMLLQGQGCRKCANEKLSEIGKQNTKHITEEYKKKFPLKVKEIHKGKIEVLDEYINKRTKIRFKCLECNHIWTARPNSVVGINQTGCPNCNKNKSKGQDKIKSILENLNINFSTEATFKQCKYKKELPFDIFINNKILIEYDGGQHFEPVEYWGGEDNFKKQIKRDKIKNQYCIENDISFIRIPYWEYDNIEYILKNVLMHFDLINKDNTYDESIVKKYLVDENWDHDKYIEMSKNYK